MLASRRALVVALACLSSFAAAQQSDQVIAERVLGPQWKQLSHRAGMIFAGTVLTAVTQTAINQTALTQTATAQTAAPDRAVSAAVPRTTPAVQLSFRVDRAIAGVEQGQILTIHEWAGAWSMHRPMSSGQHILIFLYPLSRLGFTSPVGGSLGQVALDPSGKIVANSEQKPPARIGVRDESANTHSVGVVQLERAIRSARNEVE